MDITGDKREELNDLLCKPLMMYTSFTSGSEESQKMLSQMQVSEGTVPNAGFDAANRRKEGRKKAVC